MPATLFAWLVHAYTAVGLVAAAAMAVLIVRGDDASFRLVFALMIVASAIDATDGWLARKARVKEILPRFDGRTLDDLTDFHTYTSLPLLLLWRAQALPGRAGWLLLLPLLASAYGFSQTSVKTEDGFFLGFPSWWNAVAFYAYFLHPPLWCSASVIVLLSVLTFVPSRYLYPSRGGPYAKTMIIGGVIWTVLVAVVLFQHAGDRETLTLISLTYPVAYLVLSWTLPSRQI
jgi:phosphatidylcholine synthase